MVTDCIQVGRVRPGEDVYKIQNVNFYSLATSLYDDLDSAYNKDSWDTDDDTQSNILQHPCAQLQKLFANGSFYFTPDFDLTRTVQARYLSYLIYICGSRTGTYAYTVFQNFHGVFRSTFI